MDPIDERLDRLTARHEALTESVESLLASVRQLYATAEQHTASLTADGENIRALARIAEIHERGRRVGKILKEPASNRAPKGGSSEMFGCFAFGENGSVVLPNPSAVWCESDPGSYRDEATESASEARAISDLCSDAPGRAAFPAGKRRSRRSIVRCHKWRTRLSKPDRGRAAKAAIQPTKSGRGPNTTTTVPSRSAAGCRPPSIFQLLAPPGSSAAEGARSAFAPVLRNRRASFWHSSYVAIPPVSTG